MTTMIEPSSLWSRRDSSVLAYHCLSDSRAISECASWGLRGSSMMRSLPPRPVRVPPTEVARRDPRGSHDLVSVSWPG
jgi:hypothetical protein